MKGSMTNFLKRAGDRNERLLLVLAGPLNPALDPESGLVHDTYVVLAKELISQGFCDKAVFVFNDPGPELNQGSFVITPEISGCFFSSIVKDLPRYFFQAVFVRGNWQEHGQVFHKLEFGHSFFYAADNKFLPKHIRPKDLDVIFVDDDHQKRQLETSHPETKSLVFDKPVSEHLFYPGLAERKIYDLCYVANFRQWKNHNMLFKALRKLKQRSLNLNILVGLIRPDNRELETMLFKYDVSAQVFERVDQECVARVLRQSKFSLQLGDLDANPRSLTESLATGTPVLVNQDLEGGLHLICDQTGASTSLENLDQAMEKMLLEYRNYRPYEYFYDHLRPERIVERCFSDHLN